MFVDWFKNVNANFVNVYEIYATLSTYYANTTQEKENRELYTQLTSLKKDTNVSTTDYIIRTETIFIALRNAGQTADNALIIAMILKSLPRHFNPFFHLGNSQQQGVDVLHSFVEMLKHKNH